MKNNVVVLRLHNDIDVVGIKVFRPSSLFGYVNLMCPFQFEHISIDGNEVFKYDMVNRLGEYETLAIKKSYIVNETKAKHELIRLYKELITSLWVPLHEEVRDTLTKYIQHIRTDGESTVNEQYREVLETWEPESSN